jgi:hypothetical protein
MSITRSTIAFYLDEQFRDMAESVGQDTDPNIGYKPDIDNAYRALGKSESSLATATVEDANVNAAYALAEYYAARRFWRRLGGRVNTRTGLNSYDFDGQRKQAKEMMEDAQRRCAAFGYDVSGEAWSLADLNLDWLEPELVVDA